MKKFISHAKINLGLNIISKREDGYHNIETIFYPIELNDVLEFTITDNFSIQCNDLSIPTDEKNLIYKARNILSDFIGKELNVKVALEKNIPSFAGLGGGSSNAATTLIALNEIFDLKLTQFDLLELASKIGSDVPFFILNQPAFAEGRGEILTPLPKLKLNYKILVIVPEVKVSTAWAYSNFKKSNKKIDLRLIQTKDDFEHYKDLITNDFETIVFSEFPQIKMIKDQLIKFGAIFSLLSGSGSAVYGFFPENFDLMEIKTHFTNYKVFEY
ncbi:MAG: 4-(cytidine 5'-diphospho)-2-C-methyl-D-erythritol kinase [Ignavibacteria bacterium]|nr:4-(cytidine 5'-diphospho)-2-C-methyl-D-erythritol kinase [Ignavibacteria bacterium]